MKTFYEFVDHKNLEKAIIECATLMVELDVSPTDYILEYVSKDPEAEKCLLEYIKIQEGILDGVKDFAGRALGAAKAIGGSVWNGGGLKYGLQHAQDVMSGPAAKFDTAKKALQNLVDSLKKGYKDNSGNTVSFSSIPSAGAPKYNIVQYVNQLLKNLEREHGNMPKLQQTAVSNPSMAPRGTAPAPTVP